MRVHLLGDLAWHDLIHEEQAPLRGDVRLNTSLLEPSEMCNEADDQQCNAQS